MVFEGLFRIFSTQTPNKKLARAYAELSDLSKKIRDFLVALVALRKELEQTSEVKEGERTGKLSSKKTRQVEKTFSTLKYLENVAEKRFWEAEESLKNLPVSSAEELEIAAVKDLLQELNTLINSNILDKTNRMSRKERIAAIEITLRSAYKIYEEFIKKQRREKKVAIKILGMKVGSTIRRVFEKASKENDYTVTIVKKELIRIAEEAREINDIGDPRYEIKWREIGFRKYPEIEEGHATSTMKERHANIDITLNGKHKKIHLVLWNP